MKRSIRLLARAGCPLYTSSHALGDLFPKQGKHFFL
jgi:hypothetical protein